MANERRFVPTRREHTATSIVHNGRKFHIGFGHADDGREVVEVFADARKTGSDQQGVLSDACILMSLLLQHGVSISRIAASLGELRKEGDEHGDPASVIGVIARAGAELEKE